MVNRKPGLPKLHREVPLDEAGIDALSELLVQGLEQVGIDRKDIIRLRLAAEEILGLWRSRGKQTRYVCSTRVPASDECFWRLQPQENA